MEKHKNGNAYLYSTCITQNGDVKELVRGGGSNEKLPKTWLLCLR